MRFKFKVILIFLFSFLFLISLGLLYTQTNSFRNNLKQIIEYYANKTVVGRLNIESIEGNVFKGFRINNIELRDSLDKRCISINSISVEWDIKRLLSKEVFISNIKIDSSNLYIEQYSDSLLNIKHILRSTPSKESKNDSSSYSLPFNIVFNNIDLSRSEIFLDLPLSKKLPKSIKLEINLSALISQKGNNIFVKKFNTCSSDSLIKVQTSLDYITYSSDVLKFKEFKVVTPRSNIYINGELPFKKIEDGKIKMSCHPLNLDEFQMFIDKPIHGAPNIDIDVFTKNNRLNLNLLLKENTQVISIRGEIDSLSTKSKYKADLAVSNLNLGYWLKNKDLSSNLNSNLSIKGSGVTIEELVNNISFKLYSSSIGKLKIKKAIFKGGISKGNYFVNTLMLESSGFDAVLSGNGNIKGPHFCKYKARLKNTDFISLFVEMPKIGGLVSMDGSISGVKDSLLLLSNVKLEDVSMDSLRVSRVDAYINCSIVKSKVNGTTSLNIFNSKWGKEIELKSFESSQIITDNVLDGYYKILYADSTELHTKYRLSKNRSISVQFSDFYLKSFSQEWRNESDTLLLVLDSNKISFSDFNLSSKDQTVRINGLYSFNGDQDLHLELSNINLGYIPELKYIVDYPIYGIINGRCNLNGNSDNPILYSDFVLKDASYKDVSIDSLSFKLDYKNNLLQQEAKLHKNNILLLESKAFVPMHLTLSDSSYLISNEQPSYIRLETNNIDLSQFNYLLKEKKNMISGELNSFIEAKIVDNRFEFYGHLSLDKAECAIPNYGIDYQNINLNMFLDNNTVRLDSLYLASGKHGYLSLKGMASVNKDRKGIFENIDMHLSADNFRAVNTFDNQLIFNADSRFYGSLKEPKISGGISLVRSKMNVDKYIDEPNVTPLNTPLLIKAINEQNNKLDIINMKDKENIDSLLIMRNNFLKNLRGEFNLEIPRNTWINGKNVQVEVKGFIKIVKTGNEPEFYGNISLLRGFVEFYGKKFRIDKGDIELRGGSILNPTIEVEMYYKFRDDNKKLRKLSIRIYGTAKKPLFGFSLDSETIEEKNAISYIVFGKSVDQLGYSQQSQISDTDDQVKSVVFSQLSKLFEKFLAKSVGLDVIEISGEDNWNSGSFTFGKYITNDLYVSYSQLFSIDSGSKDFVPYKLTLEYNILRSLLLQASNDGSKSGFDLIWQIRLK